MAKRNMGLTKTNKNEKIGFTNPEIGEKIMTESTKLIPCYEIQPNLDVPSVKRLLQSIADVLGGLWFNMHELDDRWITGCRAYGWVKNYLDINQGKIPGVKMISTSMDFVFTLNDVPLQFVTDRLDTPRKRHRLLINDVESRQLSFLFEQESAEQHHPHAQDVTWRVYADKFFATDDENEPPTWVLTLVGFDLSNRQVSKFELQSRVTTPIQSVNTEHLPAPVETPPTQLQRRVKNDKKHDSGKNGTV
ncbi:hypothetical protein [Tenebrionicola larvae]|uniref:hypothetical protein n=1 Tax=Tenebrionicola larvae TaxID=2815733 RepID=UPI0020111947|nr:hypothetical protein [Tenebrionicola larvae]